jgi:anaerobic ribonucleoside-triphosphate reductase activating protein
MNYSGLKKYSIGNGEGIRTSLYVSGCNFHCNGCFNPETWDFNYGLPYTDKTEEEILNLIKSDRVDGLSLLGGDPLCQSYEDIELLLQLVLKVKDLGKNTWIWSGFTWEELMQTSFNESHQLWQKRKELISACDVWVDGRFVMKERNLNLQWCGSNNQRIIDVKQSIDQNNLVLYKSDFTR